MKATDLTLPKSAPQIPQANSRLRSLAAYTVFFHDLISKRHPEEFVSQAFMIDVQPSYSWPDPSLALTSSLGGLFLPFLSSPSSANTAKSSLLETGHLALFFSMLLASETQGPDVPSFLKLLEKIDLAHLVRVLYFMFEHWLLAKDKFSLSSANDLWASTSGLGESGHLGEREYMRFQQPLWVILDKVPSSKYSNSYGSFLKPFPDRSSHSSRR